jgi:hypothetical protein
MPVFVRPTKKRATWMLLIPWRLRDDEVFENHSYELEGLQRVLLTKLGRQDEAREAAWAD